MSRKDATKIAGWFVNKYKNIQNDGLIGKPFQELYDLETLDPIPEWYLTAIEEVNQEFSLGISG